MEHNTTPAAKTFAAMVKTNSMGAARPSLPYGMPDNPHAGARRSPCVDFYGDGNGTICPVYKRRKEEAENRPGNKTADPGGNAVLPTECQECQRRIDYADQMDPYRSGAAMVPERRIKVGVIGRRLDGGSKAVYARCCYWAAEMGYDSVSDAVVALYLDEKLSLDRVGAYLRVSHGYVHKALAQLGHKTRSKCVRGSKRK